MRVDSEKVRRVGEVGGVVLFAIMLGLCAFLLVFSVVLIIQGKYLPGMAVSVVCIALSSMGRYSEAWNTRVSK